jgi:hypothetical protein
VSGLPVVGSLVGFLAIALAPIGTARERIVWSWLPAAGEATVVGLIALLWIVSGLRSTSEGQRRSRNR